jgi:hypothetical protein
VISPAPPLSGGPPSTLPNPGLSPENSLRGRLIAVRRRRLALRVRNWLGIGAVAAFSVTLFIVTFFGLLGR